MPNSYFFCERAVASTEVQGVIRGYIFIWGDADHRDQHNTFVDPARPPMLDLENGAHVRPIKYEHSQNNVIKRDTIGMINDYGFDDIGIWFTAQLNTSHSAYSKLLNEITSGQLFTSSATMPHTMDFYDDGAFKAWTVGEVTLTKSPSERYIPVVELIRSAPNDESTEGEQDAARADMSADDLLTDAPALGAASPPSSEQDPSKEENKRMSLEQQIAAILIDASLSDAEKMAKINALVAAQTPAPEAEMETEMAPAGVMSAPVEQSARNRQPAADTGLATLMSQLITQTAQANTAMATRMAQIEAGQRAAVNAPPVQENVRKGGNMSGIGANVNLIETRKYAQISTDQMFAMSEVMRSAGIQPTDGFTRSLAHRALEFVKRESRNPVIESYRSAYTRADDFMASNITGQGEEWAGVFYSEQIWEKARTQPIMQALLAKGIMDMDVPEGRDRVNVPLESSDSVFYTTAQSNDKDSGGLPETTVNVGFTGTASASIRPGQLTAAVGYTDILSEDAVLASGLVAQLTRQMNEAAIRMPEYVFINGDIETAASTNINRIDGTPGGGLNAPAYLVSDGALKLALVTNTSQARDGGALTDDDFRLTKGLLSGDARSNPDGIVFILDPDTYDTALAMLATKTRDVAGVDATLFTGKLPPLFGVDILRSGQMALANSAGKIPVAGGTLGRILAIYAPDWAMVWKRRITFETARLPFSQTNAIICSMRLAVRARDASLATSKAAGVSYNLTVNA